MKQRPTNKRMALSCRNCDVPLKKTNRAFCSRLCAIAVTPSLRTKGKGKNRMRVRVNGKREYYYRVLYCEYHNLTLGVDVTSDDIIHHVDDNPDNNSIENLELLKGGTDARREHIRKHRIWEKRSGGHIETLEMNGKDCSF